jgi:hypothetical protein
MHTYLRTLISLLIFITLPCFGEDDPDALMKAYFEDFNANVDAKKLVSRYWYSTVTLYTPDSVEFLSTPREVARWYEDLQTSISDQGWVRSDILESKLCRSSENTAIYGIRFNRIFDNGNTSPGAAAYILIYQGQWRIAGLIFADPDKLIGCA